jgi:hypothetical protein
MKYIQESTKQEYSNLSDNVPQISWIPIICSVFESSGWKKVHFSEVARRENEMAFGFHFDRREFPMAVAYVFHYCTTSEPYITDLSFGFHAYQGCIAPGIRTASFKEGVFLLKDSLGNVKEIVSNFKDALKYIMETGQDST